MAEPNRPRNRSDSSPLDVSPLNVAWPDAIDRDDSRSLHSSRGMRSPHSSDEVDSRSVFPSAASSPWSDLNVDSRSDDPSASRSLHSSRGTRSPHPNIRLTPPPPQSSLLRFVPNPIVYSWSGKGVCQILPLNKIDKDLLYLNTNWTCESCGSKEQISVDLNTDDIQKVRGRVERFVEREAKPRLEWSVESLIEGNGPPVCWLHPTMHECVECYKWMKPDQVQVEDVDWLYFYLTEKLVLLGNDALCYFLRRNGMKHKKKLKADLVTLVYLRITCKLFPEMTKVDDYCYNFSDPRIASSIPH